MPAPSKLRIASQSVKRLVKEEASYHKELEGQEKRIKQLESSTEDENAEYQLKQERQGVQETVAILPNLRRKIKDALEELKSQLVAIQEGGADADADDLTDAREAAAAAEKAVRET